MPECGIEGWAKVFGIGKCPQISPRPGPEFQLVTATFKHHAKQILDVYIAGETEPIGTTPNHPFWSVDQQRFVRADELTAGEQLKKANGSFTTVAQIVPRTGTQTVYNLEIQCTHTYHVARSGVLVHNSGPCNIRTVDIRKLQYPSSRPFADARKLKRHGPFDLNKYTPAEVRIKKNGVMEEQGGVTRIENALRAALERGDESLYFLPVEIINR